MFHRCCRAAKMLFLLLIIPLGLHAEQLPFTFYNNGVKLLVSRASSERGSVIKVEVRAPHQSGFRIFKAESPSRLVIDFHRARITRSRTFTLSDSDSVKSVRCGVHPDHLRVVIEFKTKEVPEYHSSLKGDWFSLIVNESGEEIRTPEASTESLHWPPKLDQFEFRSSFWNKTAGDLSSDQPDEESGSNHLEIRPSVSYEPDSESKVLVSGRGDLFTSLDSDGPNDGEMKVHEAYVDLYDPSYNLRVGNQIVTWGKADEISPLDIVNPEDYRDGFVRRRSERKLAIPMVNGELLGNDERLQALYIPVFRRSRVNLGGSDWALFGNQADQLMIDESYQSDWFESGEYGIRYAGTFKSFDAAVSYFSSRSDLPVIQGTGLPPGAAPLNHTINRGELAQLSQISGVPLMTDYPRRDVWGAELETVYDSIGIRGDFAYTDGEQFITDTFYTRSNRTYAGTLGIDYSSAEDLYFNVQYSYRVIDQYQEDYLMVERMQHGIYSEVSQMVWGSYGKLGFRSLLGFPEEQQYYNPYFLLSYWDDLTFEFGLDIINGETTSVVGFYEDNDQAYVIMRAYL